MNKPLLVAFTGLAGIGKDTAADYLVKTRRLHKYSFAQKMKEGVQKMFDLSEAQVFGSKDAKEQPIDKLSKKKPISGRFLMQTLATEWARDIIDPDIWIYNVDAQWQGMKNIPGFQGAVISDLRFDNEADWVRENGGLIIKLVGPGEEVVNGMAGHTSESGIKFHHQTANIVNDKSSFAKLYGTIDEVIYQFVYKQHYHTPPRNIKPIEVYSLNKELPIKDLIVGWADSVFPDRTITNAIHKMVLEEIPEYLMAQDDPLELADIGILLYDIAHLAGIDLDAAIREKMGINMNRKWEINQSTGLMKHVEKKDE